MRRRWLHDLCVDTLACSANCADFDVTQCVTLATDGNDQIDDNELCDGSALNGATCESLGAGTGTLACADQQPDSGQVDPVDLSGLASKTT